MSNLQGREPKTQQVHAVVSEPAHANLRFVARTYHGGGISAAVEEAAARLLRVTFAERDIGDPVNQARTRLLGFAHLKGAAADLVGAAATTMIHSEMACEDTAPDDILGQELLPLERAMAWVGAYRFSVLVRAGVRTLESATMHDIVDLSI